MWQILYEKSIYKTFRDGKRIMSFKKYSFIPDAVDGVPLFKITDEKVRYPFVSDAFKETVEKINYLVLCFDWFGIATKLTEQSYFP